MSPTAQGHLAMLGFSAFVAGSFPLGALVAPHIDPAALTAVRLLLACLVLGAIAVARGEASPTVLREPWRYVLLAGTYAYYFTAMFIALGMTTPVSLSAVFTLSPALAAVVGYLMLRQVTNGWMALAIAVGGAGALWVIFDGSLTQAATLAFGKGELLYLSGCFAHACIPALLRKLDRGEAAMPFNATIFGVGAILLGIYAWPEIRSTDWAALPPIVWITLGYTAIVATAISFQLMRFAALRLPAAKVMAYTYLAPTWVILWQLCLIGDLPHAAVLPGVLLSFAALAMLLRDGRSRRPTTTPA